MAARIGSQVYNTQFHNIVCDIDTSKVKVEFLYGKDGILIGPPLSSAEFKSMTIELSLHFWLHKAHPNPVSKRESSIFKETP